MPTKTRFLRRTVFGLVAIAALNAIVMLLWNDMIPELFAGGRAIDYVRSLGWLMLSGILFGGFQGRGGGIGIVVDGTVVREAR